nr:reverse transcriptase domain-containing protein [Tanacetum cinerariifolium]
MSTHSSARNLFAPLDNLELTIRRRSRADPTLLNDFEMATKGNCDPIVPDLRTMEDLYQPSLNGRGGPIAPIAIQAMKFGLKNDMIQQVQNSFQFHGVLGDDANKHLDKFLHVTQSIKVNGVTDDTSCHRLLRNKITNFRQRPDESLFKAWEPYKLSIDRGTFMKRRPEDCYDLIENMTAHHNDWDTSAQRITVGQTQNVYAAGAYQGGNSYQPQGAIHGQNSPPAYQAPAYQAPAYQAPGYQAPVHQPSIPQPHVVTTIEFKNYMKANDVILKNMQTNMTTLINSNLKLKNIFGQFMKINTASASGSGTLPWLKGITTRSGTAYQGPTIPTTSSSLPKVVLRENEVIKDTVPPTDNRSTKDVQPSVVQTKSPIPNSEPIVAPVVEPVVAPVSAPNPNPKPSIPYPSRLHDQKLHDKMTLELADRSISRPIGVAEDVFVKVGKFHFLADLIVVDFVVDPRVPLILERSFLKTKKALIDVYEGELTLRVGKEAITFNLDQTSRYSANYNDMMANRIDVIDMACEEYS